MSKYSIKLVTILFLLAIILNPANAILVNGSALGANQLTIDIQPLIPKVWEITIITVTSGTGNPQESAEVSFDGEVIGITNVTGQLKYMPNHNGSFNITATKLGYEKAIKNIQVSGFMTNPMNIRCSSNYSLIEHNIVIVIDASGSTYGQDPNTGNSFIDLINANAISIVQSISRDTRVGVVAFGDVATKTNMLQMSSDVNRTELIKFIKGNNSKISMTTNLEEGLIFAEDLLNTVNETKEIIIISDGLFPPDGFDHLKKNVITLINKEIRFQFIQVLLSQAPNKEPMRLYNELAKVSDEQVIVLNPDERAGSLIKVIPSKEPFHEEPCSIRINDTAEISLTMNNGDPIEGAEIRFDNNPIGTTNRFGMLSFYTINSGGLHNITATKPGYEKVLRSVQVLPIPTATQNQSVKINPTYNQESLGVSNQSKETPAEIKGTPGFKGAVAFIALFVIIIVRRVF